MKHNMGKADRVIRSIVGLGLLYAIFSKALSGLLAVILGLFAVVLLATATFGYCPPYGWLGIKTCKCEEHDDKKAATS